ncbi:hypothetical protein HMPREF1015_02753 [Bacillus smithii 7_3_47FAA]|jgi:hypothetical protein|uniref:Uncharacterized protein n=1 Tax=Bacillus smithii 7_3_47FAA TaxID=665952 RepID=G9QNL0_9BACI|nr:Hypothetical protein BSM4216_3775 [Bacillus smithii]EHL75603.1 hypothetical protein HMPREF1015_02753 [Bacillus smithii 7_3_47FAA]
MRIMYSIIFIVSLIIIAYFSKTNYINQTSGKIIVAVAFGFLVSSILNIFKKRK